MQGRFKRDGSAAAEQEPRGGTDRGTSPQHSPYPGPAPAGDGGDRAARSPGGREATGAAGALKAARAGRAARAAGKSRPDSAPPALPKGPGQSGDTAAQDGKDGKGGGKDAKNPKPAKGGKGKAPGDTGSRIALRNWRISTRLVSLLALPVVAATSLGGLRIQESMENMEQLDHMQLLTKLTREAHYLAQALQSERDLTAGPLANGYPVTDFKITQPRGETDAAQRAFLDATQEIGDTQDDEALSSIRANVTQIANQVVTIGSIRKEAYADGRMSSATVGKYNRLIESLLTLSQDMAQATSNPDMIKRTRALAAFSSAKEYASIQRAVIAAALPKSAVSGKNRELNVNDRQYAEDARVNENAQLKSFRSIYESAGGDASTLLAPLNSGNPSIQAADEYAGRVLRGQNGLSNMPARSFLDWTDESDTKLKMMTTIEETLLSKVEEKARELRQEAQRDAIINGALILLVLGVSLVGAFVVARSMVQSLRRLQDTATKVAQERLPQLVKHLSEADPQDVDTSVESVGVHSRDEIGKVAAAFDDVHREAVRLAAEQALLRGNVNAMFTNLSRRSQGLIQRQLSLISELESREADPDQLASLFKLDHLATRMRRNGENLLVLAGEEPGRRWTRPVPLVDVLRAAASEVEQYERIELASVPGTEVAGRVVNDLVHLLAELLENATSFSSPQTKVRVTGHALPDGRVLVEIHDTGIGLSPEDLAAINERLASPPTVDVSVSRRMGLFVVGRLSLRHGIRIQLRPSDSGGTTALVMLPVDVTQGGKKPAPGTPGAPAVPGGQGGQARPGGAPGGTGLAGAPGGSRAGLPGGQSGTGGPGAGGPGSQNRYGAGSGTGTGTGPGAGQRGGVQGGNGMQGGGQPGRQPQQPPRDPQRQGQGGGFAGGSYGDPGRSYGDAGAFGDTAGRGAQAGAGAGGGTPSRPDMWQGGQNQQHPQGGQDRQPMPGAAGGRGGQPGAGHPQRSAQPGAAGWGPDQRGPEGPRGHEEPAGSTGRFAQLPAETQGPGSTAEFPRPDFDGPRPDQNGARGDQAGDPASTAALPRADFGAPQDDSRALPPAGNPSEGRTPLYDTLETNWFHGQQGQPGQQGPAQSGPGRQDRPAPQGQGRPGGDDRYPMHDQTMPTPALPQQPAQGRTAPSLPAPAGGRPAPLGRDRFGQGAGPAGRRAFGQEHGPGAQQNGQANGSDAASTTGSWRITPNDELSRQAERARKPEAGGVTTSGLPRRVPRANLVPGTAQDTPQETGPQVSRAPDDVRGRLTNLRRGIQQGRQAGSGNTGSFSVGNTHPQEREF
ncbi:nitrate- and nitrite sensing domain-containing protein [Streptomyces sp. CC77]|uniref:sensor histidine kinase n=1 Tax=Streptomyces sp. CC77 TaxID=1906739 RepID=UPI0008DDE347|nr:nitrate- and nitrite sensing domain-containing protein [Streptomyces sp. CC77]OII67136.1 histidine kinase [Streptomyces sp. CC77]